MKKILIFLGLLVGMTGYGQNVIRIGGSGSSGISAIDSTVTLKNLKPDSNPDSILTKINGFPGIATVADYDDLGIGSTITAYSAGTAYSLTATHALLDFSTTDPAITITSAGTWLIMAGANLKLNGATFAATETAACKVRRTNNTAADLTSAADSITIPIVTTATQHAGTVRIPSIIYTTTNTTDILQVFGRVLVTPSAGSIDATSSFIVAIKLR